MNFEHRGRRLNSEIDPLIYYCFVLGDDDPHETSPFQGFSPDWQALLWAMRRLVELPANVVDPAMPRQAVLARRMGGIGGWHWFPIAVRALDRVGIDISAPFWVVFSGTPQVAKAVSAWAERQVLRPLHVSASSRDGAIGEDALNETRIQLHIRETLHEVRQQNPSLEVGLIEEALPEWRNWPSVAASFPKRTHNCTLPNNMALEAAGVVFEDSLPLVGGSTDDYVAAIRESVEAVRRLRNDVGEVPGFRLTPPHPGLILTAPALFQHANAKLRPVSRDDAKDPQIVYKVMRILQRKKTFHWSVEPEELQRILASQEATGIIRTRQEELEVHTLAVGLRGASTLAATLRVPPAVNRTAGVVRQLAVHARNVDVNQSRKFTRLFSLVQRALEDAVGPDLLQLIAETEGAIKLVTDAPMEWLPVGDLPLGLKFDCSRITATPGNLMVGELVLPKLLRLKASAFSDILFVTAFGAEDPIGHLLPAKLDALAPLWRENLTIRSFAVTNESEFCEALNSYDGGILIFDGHGQHREDSGLGTLVIGEQEVDMWSLRNRVRVPPVVVLSACDTQAIDRSHATTANAFLEAGSRAVLGTLLPINANRAAMFVCRLLLRLAEFVPAVTLARGAAVHWSEVIGGMLRVQLLTDLLQPRLHSGELSEEDYNDIHVQGNTAINSLRPDWLDFVAGLTAERLSSPRGVVLNKFRNGIAVSDVIRCVHMGNPETILVLDDSESSAIG